MKKLVSALLILAVLFSFSACAEGGSKEIFLTTGDETGTYYGYGTVLANCVSANTGEKITAIAGKGSKANLEDMEGNLAQMGFCQSDVMNYAVSGERLFEKKISGISAAAALYMEQVQIVTANPEIITVSDLAGKTVSLGESGSGTYFNAMDVLSAYGFSEDDIRPVYQSFSESADSIKDGKIDAAFIVAGSPTAAIADLSSGKNVHLLTIDDEHILKLLESCPYYSASTISAGSYSGMEEDVKTVAIAALLLARDDLPSDAVYRFLTTVFEKKDELSEQHAKGAELDLKFASSISGIPVHPGAVKFFAEKGISLP